MTIDTIIKTLRGWAETMGRDSNKFPELQWRPSAGAVDDLADALEAEVRKGAVRPVQIFPIVTGAYMGDMKKVVAYARGVADLWDAHGDDFAARQMRDLCDKIERGDELQKIVALAAPQPAIPDGCRVVWCTPTEHEGRIVYEHTDEPMPGADSFRLYAAAPPPPSGDAGKENTR